MLAEDKVVKPLHLRCLKAVKQTVTIPNVNQKKEYLVVHYTLTYNSKGSELQMWESTVVKENNSEKVDIKI